MQPAFIMTQVFSKQFIEEITLQLKREQERLERELGYFEDKATGDNYTTKFPKYGDDEDENAQEVATFETRLSVGSTLEKELRDVRKALELIAEGNYGICKYCGNPIDERRLRARPTSTSCVSCKNKLKNQ